jgi:hypothetical protein
MWEASLIDRDKSLASLRENFDDLFYEFQKNNMEFDDAFSYLDPAIAAHLPNRAVVKNTYKRMSNKNQFDSEIDFFNSWKQIIKDHATNSFYSFFQIDEEEEDKLPNGMSLQEYSKQRRHAHSFPLLDVSKIPDVEEQIEDLTLDDLET